VTTDKTVKLSEADELRAHWHSFCDCDVFEGADTFAERMEDAGLIELRDVEQSDIDENPFASELGIELGGMIWVLTDAGRAILNGEKTND